ncbi:MAG TPA: ABC transporter substrate-binding protein, partial [Stellaceae bacterium]|nr:ABC transporter substrate-binding protein [Stellaceae bacterium]
LALLLSAGVAAAANTKVTIGYAMGNGWIPAFVAKDQDIFARHGIDAQLQLMTNGSSAPAALMANSLQIAGLNPTAVILADDGGADIQIIANATIQTKTTSDGWLFARTGLELHSPKDLIGKKVAVPAIDSVAHVALMRWLQLEKVDPKQVTYVEIPMNHIRDALQAGQVEAAIVVEPFADQIEKSKAGYMMADFNAALANPVTTHSVWAMLKHTIDAHPDVVSGFRQSLREAIVWIKALPKKRG